MDIVHAEIFYPQGVEKIANIESEGLKAKFYAPTKYAMWRYKTLFLKEPETIEWLRALESHDVLWDVGANVGIYTIYAALTKRCRVIAIEPGAANYYTLCRNIELNRLDRYVTAYCLALGESHKCTELFLSDTQSGGAQNAIDRALDDRGKPFDAKFRQGILSVSIDIMVNELGAPLPTAMKIDVDGFELYVLKGAKLTLANPNFRKISVEMDSSNKEVVSEITALLSSAGFKKTGEHRSPYVAPNSPIHNFHFEKT